jgi:hypothetical protein
MTEALAARYRRVVETGMRGHSPRYEAPANGVAGGPSALDFVASRPPSKRQPDLPLDALRHSGGARPD